MKKGRLMGQGRTAEVFEWGEEKILKLFRTGIPKEVVQSEYKICLEISKRLKLVPKVYELVEIENRTGIIYERIKGTTMMKTIVIKPWRTKKEARRLAQLHQAIQQEADFDLPEYKTRLKNDIARTELLGEEIKTNLYQYIDGLKDSNKICHGDFHPDNILITKEQTIIIDWMTASKGNPLADVARTAVMFKYAVIPEKSYIEKKVIDFIRRKLYREYIRHYMSITDTKAEQIEEWELPIAAARLTEWIPPEEKETLLSFINTEIIKRTGFKA